MSLNVIFGVCLLMSKAVSYEIAAAIELFHLTKLLS